MCPLLDSMNHHPNALVEAPQLAKRRQRQRLAMVRSLPVAWPCPAIAKAGGLWLPPGASYGLGEEAWSHRQILRRKAKELSWCKSMLKHAQAVRIRLLA